KTEVRIDSHPGGAAANRIRPFSEFGVTADNKAGRLRHSLFPICEYLRHLRLRHSDFGLLSGFGRRSSDFRAAEHDGGRVRIHLFCRGAIDRYRQIDRDLFILRHLRKTYRANRSK
ncbi:MAG: hypothetical protein WCQ21_15150, partial [Verrucomicrobiota bacterium]